jgi:hypothetical protein
MLTESPARGNRPFVVLAGGEDRSESLRRLSPARWRCRPGEQPVWVRLSLDVREGDLLRERAAHAHVPVDAWLAIMLDCRWALGLLAGKLGCGGAAREELAGLIRRTPVRLAPTSALRSWQRSLTYRGPGTITGGAGADELPEAVLPQRVAARLRTLDAGGRPDVPGALAASADWPLACACELRASGLGESLERFAVKASLR